MAFSRSGPLKPREWRLVDLGDVDVRSATVGQALVYKGQGTWGPGSGGGGGATRLVDLEDTNFEGVEPGEQPGIFLVYDKFTGQSVYSWQAVVVSNYWSGSPSVNRRAGLQTLVRNESTNAFPNLGDGAFPSMTTSAYTMWSGMRGANSSAVDGDMLVMRTVAGNPRWNAEVVTLDFFVTSGVKQIGSFPTAITSGPGAGTFRWSGMRGDTETAPTPAPVWGDFLRWDESAEKWVARPMYRATGLSPVTGDVLTYQASPGGSQKWIAAPPTGGGGGATRLGELTDVDLGGVNPLPDNYGYVLAYGPDPENPTALPWKWRNVGGLYNDATTTGQFMQWSYPTGWGMVGLRTDASSAAEGDFLRCNSSGNWQAYPANAVFSAEEGTGLGYIVLSNLIAVDTYPAAPTPPGPPPIFHRTTGAIPMYEGGTDAVGNWSYVGLNKNGLSPNHKDVLTYIFDEGGIAKHRWEARAPALGEYELAISSPAPNDYIRFDGTNWVNTPGNVVTTPASPPIGDEYVLVYKAGAINAWTPTAQTALSLITFAQLADVNLTTPSNGQFLQFNGTHWVNINFPTQYLDDLGDVTLTAPGAGQILQYDGSVWRNENPAAQSLNDLTDVTLTAPTEGQLLVLDSDGQWKNQGPIVLENMANVTVTSPADGDVLTYDSTLPGWKNAAPATGGAELRYVWVTRSTNQSIAENTDTFVEWDATAPGSGAGAWAITPNPTRLTALYTGVYRLTVTIAWASSALGVRGVGYAVNGTIPTLGGLMDTRNTVAGIFTIQTVSTTLTLNAGGTPDYLEVVVSQSGEVLGLDILGPRCQANLEYLGAVP